MKTKVLEPKIVGITSIAFTLLNIIVILLIGYVTFTAKESVKFLIEQQGKTSLPFFSDFLISVPKSSYIIWIIIISLSLIAKEFLDKRSIALFINAMTLILSFIYLFICILFLFSLLSISCM